MCANKVGPGFRLKRLAGEQLLEDGPAPEWEAFAALDNR